jgi:hypothetical protein
MKKISLPPGQLHDGERQSGKGDPDVNGGFRRADSRRPCRVAEQSVAQSHGGHRKYDQASGQGDCLDRLDAFASRVECVSRHDAPNVPKSSVH